MLSVGPALMLFVLAHGLVFKQWILGYFLLPRVEGGAGKLLLRHTGSEELRTVVRSARSSLPDSCERRSGNGA